MVHWKVEIWPPPCAKNHIYIPFTIPNKMKRGSVEISVSFLLAILLACYWYRKKKIRRLNFPIKEHKKHPYCHHPRPHHFIPLKYLIAV